MSDDELNEIIDKQLEELAQLQSECDAAIKRGVALAHELAEERRGDALIRETLALA